jgi:hypothetical protein
MSVIKNKYSVATATLVLLALLFTLSFTGCAGRVPQEVVDLSTIIGSDMETLHLSYRELITRHFKLLRMQVDDFFQNRWLPIYIDDFMKEGDLQSRSQTPDPKERAEKVNVWVQVAMEESADKHKELMAPIDADEASLLKEVDDAFELLKKANGKVTTFLESMKKVGESREEIVKIFKLDGLRNKISSVLGVASKRFEDKKKELEKSVPKKSSNNSQPVPAPTPSDGTF